MTGKERKKLIFVAGNQAYKRKVNFVIFYGYLCIFFILHDI